MASDSLRAEMQIVDSRRSIAEAESISKLTELAFVFVPLSFVASLFGMQIHELHNGVLLYQFLLVASGFVVMSYAVRLSIRNARIIDSKDKAFIQIREDSQLQYNEPIPTHKFLVWFGRTTGSAVYSTIKKTIIAFASLVLILMAIGIPLSPIIMLWLRRIDKGFSAVITVLVLLLYIPLVYSVLISIYGDFDFSPKATLREYLKARELQQKRKTRAKQKRRRKTGPDVENLEGERSPTGDEGSSSRGVSGS
jgi:hypothetical protein